MFNPELDGKVEPLKQHRQPCMSRLLLRKNSALADAMMKATEKQLAKSGN